MENVDFSQAELKGLSFLNGIDLRQCKFPKGDNYLLVTNPARTYKIAAELVRNTWHGEEQRRALILIKIHNANEGDAKPVDFIDISLPSDNGKRLDLGRKFFETLRESNGAGIQGAELGYTKKLTHNEVCLEKLDFQGNITRRNMITMPRSHCVSIDKDYGRMASDRDLSIVFPDHSSTKYDVITPI